MLDSPLAVQFSLFQSWSKLNFSPGQQIEKEVGPFEESLPSFILRLC